MTTKCTAMWFVQNHDEDHIPNGDKITVALGPLPFGSMPAPAEFSNCSNITFDLANNLMNCDHWDLIVYPSPLEKEIPPPKGLSNDIKFGPAFKAVVQLPINFKGDTDGYYIDDRATCVLDSKENQKMSSKQNNALQWYIALTVQT